MKIVEYNKEDYTKSLEELSRLLTEAAKKCTISEKKLPTYDDFTSMTVPVMERVYANFDIRGVLRKDCKHEQSTILIESDENGNKSQTTICSICGKLLPKSDINQDSVI